MGFQENFKNVAARYKQYNIYSDKLLACLPDVKLKQVVYFRVLGISPDPINKGRLKIPTVLIPPSVRVFDPGHESFIDCAAIKSIGLDDKPVFYEGELSFRKETGGHIVLNMLNPDHQRLFLYMYLSPYNKSFQYRNPSVEPLYEYVDPARTANQRIKDVRERNLATEVILDMTDEDVRSHIASMGGDYTDDVEVLRATLLETAMQNPSKFMSLSPNPEAEAKLVISDALNASIIRRVNPKREWQWADEGITLLEAPKGVNMEDALVDYFLNKPEGIEAYRTIKNQLRS